MAPLPAPTPAPIAAPFLPFAAPPIAAPATVVPATVSLSRCFCQKVRLWRRCRLVCADAIGPAENTSISTINKLDRILFILSSVLIVHTLPSEYVLIQSNLKFPSL